jgi:hypothetical protein
MRQPIRQVLKAAFPTPVESRLVDDLRRAGRLTISLVAVVDGQLVGHIAFSPVTVGAVDRGTAFPATNIEDARASACGLVLNQAKALGFVASRGSVHRRAR